MREWTSGGIGPDSLDGANITWRQEVGGSAIGALKIAGQSGLEMTSEHTFVAPERQNELTRRIQEKAASAANKLEGKANDQAPPGPATPEILRLLA